MQRKKKIQSRRKIIISKNKESGRKKSKNDEKNR